MPLSSGTQGIARRFLINCILIFLVNTLVTGVNQVIDHIFCSTTH